MEKENKVFKNIHQLAEETLSAIWKGKKLKVWKDGNLVEKGVIADVSFYGWEEDHGCCSASGVKFSIRLENGKLIDVEYEMVEIE